MTFMDEQEQVAELLEALVNLRFEASQFQIVRAGRRPLFDKAVAQAEAIIAKHKKGPRQ